MKTSHRSSAARAAVDRGKSRVHVQLANEQRRWPVAKSRLTAAVRGVLAGEGIKRAVISLAVVDDRTIHRLNRKYLNHDEPTDVVSFVLDEAPGFVEGEIVVSADTAAASAPCYGWSTANELLLYVIHGALHLVGYDDHGRQAKRAMRRREQKYLEMFSGGAASQKPKRKSRNVNRKES